MKQELSAGRKAAPIFSWALALVVAFITYGCQVSDILVVQLIYSLAIPFITFGVLSILIKRTKEDGSPLFGAAELWGAYAAAIVIILFPHLYFGYKIGHYKGGGVDFGAIFMVWGIPVYLVPGIFIGMLIGKRFGKTS